MKEQHIFTDLPVTSYMLTRQSTPFEQHKEAASVKKKHQHTPARAQPEDLYAATIKAYIREHYGLLLN